MNTALPSSMPEILQLSLFLLVVAAALTDLKFRRIPNWIALAGVSTGIVLNSYFGGWHGFTAACLGMFLGAGLFAGLYLAGGMGAGDVKLLAAVGSMVGPHALLVIFVLAGMFGGCVALGVSLWHGRVRDMLIRTIRLAGRMARFDWAEVKNRSVRSAAGAMALPYGAVVATGTLVFLFALRHTVR